MFAHICSTWEYCHWLTAEVKLALKASFVNFKQYRDIPVILNVANLCSKSCARLLTKCIEIVVKSDLDTVTLDKALPPDIVKQIIDLRSSFGVVRPESSGFSNKHAKRIHGALDSDDVGLIRMLLKEGYTSLDDSYTLHYAVVHCDSKITTALPIPPISWTKRATLFFYIL